MLNVDAAPRPAALNTVDRRTAELVAAWELRNGRPYDPTPPAGDAAFERLRALGFGRMSPQERDFWRANYPGHQPCPAPDNAHQQRGEREE